MGGAATFPGQQQPLRHPETMLFVDHREGEIAVGHAVLKNRMGTDHHIDAAVEQAHQDRFAGAAFIPPGQQGQPHSGARQQPRQRVVMLARQDLGGGEQRRLRPRLDRDQHRRQRDHGLARSDIALQQPQHRRRLRQVAGDFGNRPMLGAGQRKWQVQLGQQPPIPLQRCATPRPPGGAHQHQRQRIGQQFIIGQPVARLGVFGAVAEVHCLAPVGPLHFGQQPWLDPFGQHRQHRQRLRDQRRQPSLGETNRERIDRLDQLPQCRAAFLGDMIRMDDLEHLTVLVEPPRDPLGHAQRQLLFRAMADASKIRQRADVADRIACQHPQRPAPGAAAVFDRGQRHHHLFTDAGLVEIGDRAATDKTVGKMIGQIAQPRQLQPCERARQTGADALQPGGFGKQRIEEIGTHRRFIAGRRGSARYRKARPGTPLPPAGAAGGGHLPYPRTLASRKKEPTPERSRKRAGDASRR